MKYLLRGVLACALLFFGSSALADTLVDTGSGKDHGSGYNLLSFQGLAGRFELFDDAQVTAVQGWIAAGAPGPTVTATIYREADYLPVHALYSGDFTLTGNGWQGLSGLNWSLEAGTYWVAFTTDYRGFDVVMPIDTPNPLKSYAYGTAGNWRVSNTPLNFGVRIEGTSGPSGVPEPASWAMLIGGFGIAGAAFRARRSRTTALA